VRALEKLRGRQSNYALGILDADLQALLTISVLKPCGAVPKQPANAGLLQSDVGLRLFAFEPLVPENLVALGRELSHEE
jgi:hypothetical protein